MKAAGYGDLEDLAAGHCPDPQGLAAHQRAAAALLATRRGDPATARGLLESVLDAQVSAPGQMWHATFDAVPTGPVAWYDGWDPNSRSLVGLVLATGLATAAWPRTLVSRCRDVLAISCAAEEDCARIPVTYTNITLAHAASCAVAGIVTGDPSLTRLAASRAAEALEDLRRRGGMMEHASPTYGGVSLAAAAVLADTLPEPVTRDLLVALSAEVLVDFDPTLGEITGPWVRAYGLRLGTHVALTSAALARHHRLAPSPDAAHAEDWPMVSVVVATDAGRHLDQQMAQVPVRDIAGLGTVSVARSPMAIWGGLFVDPDAWHHQTFSATLHTPTAAIGLCDSRIAATADDGGLHLTVQPAATGQPAWLWGALPRPERYAAPPEHLVWSLDGDVELVSPRRLRVGPLTAIAPVDWGWDGEVATLPVQDLRLTLHPA